MSSSGYCHKPFLKSKKWKKKLMFNSLATKRVQLNKTLECNNKS